MFYYIWFWWKGWFLLENSKFPLVWYFLKGPLSCRFGRILDEFVWNCCNLREYIWLCGVLCTLSILGCLLFLGRVSGQYNVYRIRFQTFFVQTLANTPNQAETLLHSLEGAATDIGLHVNAHKTEYMCYNQTGDISTLDGTSLKLVDKFTYLGSSISSTEKDISTRLTKAWQLSIGSRSYGNQIWPIKWNAVSSRKRSCRYCCKDALLGR